MRSRPLQLIAAVGIVLLPLAACGRGKSYDFPSVRIDATVNQDGSLSIVESRTFHFDGHFHFAYFTVDHKQFDDVTGFSLSENGTVYTVGEPEVPGHIQLEDNVLEGPGGFKYKATWWFDAQDQDRTFTIRYNVLCAVDAYSDTANLLWKFIGEGWTVPTRSAVITVHLPGAAKTAPERPTTQCNPNIPPGTPGGPLLNPPPVATKPLRQSQVQAWGHGPLNGSVRFADPQTVVLSVTDLRPSIFVEGSILFPLRSVPFEALKDEPGRAAIQAEEARLAREANRARLEARATLSRHRLWSWIGAAALVLLPLLGLAMILVARRRDHVPGVPKYLQEPPEPDRHPAVLAAAWAWWTRKGVGGTGNAFRAQLLHLAREGCVEAVPLGTVTDARDYELHLRKRPKDTMDRKFAAALFDLDDHEWSRDGHEVREEPIRLDTFKPNTKQSKALHGWWIWADTTADDLHKRGGHRFEVSIPRWLVLGSLVLSPFLALMAGRGWFPWTALAFAVALVVAIVVARSVPRGLAGEDLERMVKWRAFRRWLKHFSSLDDAPAAAVVIWEQYLVFAVALDMAKRVEEQVRALVPAEMLPSPWPGAPSGTMAYGVIHQFSSGSLQASAIGAALGGSSTSSLSSTSSSSWSSSSGGGGGFSGGGGGGGGGTGGGAG